MTKSVEYHINHHNINKALNSSSNLTLTSNTRSNLMLTTQDVHSNFAVSFCDFCKVIGSTIIFATFAQ